MCIRWNRNFNKNVLVGFTLLYFVHFGVDGRHISLKKHKTSRGETITDDAVTIEAVPPPTSKETSTILRAGYALHLRNNLKKAFALQLLHQSQTQNQYNKNPTSDEFITLKNKRPNKLRLLKLKQATPPGASTLRAHHIPLFPSYEELEDLSPERDESDDEDATHFASFDMAVTHPEEDPHFYQERYKTIGDKQGGGGDEQSDEMQPNNKGFSLVNSYFDNEYSISMLHRMECVTPTKSKGYCSTFRACVPSLFNSAGELEAPALAELVSMSIGYCSSSVPSDQDASSNHLLKRTGQRYAAVANRIICCPGTPPSPGTSAEDDSAEKFNDFLGGSDSFLQQDEDDVNQGPSSIGVKDTIKDADDNKKDTPNGGNDMVDLKGEFVQHNEDTEAEVWHSEEDIKAAKNKKPANIIPIEAFIPADKLAQYDPHTNTFSKEIFDTLPKDKTESNQSLSNISQSLSEPQSEENIQPDQQMTQNDDGVQDEDLSATPTNDINQNSDDESQTSTFAPLSPPSISSNSEEILPPPLDNGIISGESQEYLTTVHPDSDNLLPTATTATTNEESTTTTTVHGENSTFIKLSPEPVNGANGKFTLENGVHIQMASPETPRPPPNPSNQVNIAETTVNIIKAAETTIDSNQILQTNQNIQDKYLPETQNQEVQVGFNQPIDIVQSTPTDQPNEEISQPPEIITDAYNNYHVHNDSQDEEPETTVAPPLYTTTQNYEIQQTTTISPLKVIQTEAEQGSHNEGIGDHVPSTMMPHFEDISNHVGNFETIYPTAVTPGDSDATTEYPNPVKAFEDVGGNDHANEQQDEHQLPETTTTNSVQENESYGESTTFNPNNNVLDPHSFDKTPESISNVPHENTIHHHDTPSTSNDMSSNNGNVNDVINNANTAPEFQPTSHDLSSPHSSGNGNTDRVNNNANTAPEFQPTSHDMSSPHASGNGNIDRVNDNANTTPQFQEIPHENPITQLFPTGAATLSPQNGQNSLENESPTQNILSSSKDTLLFSGITNQDNQQVQPSRENDDQGEGSGSNQSTSNESTSDEENRPGLLFEPTKTKPQIQTDNSIRPPRPPHPTPEPELGGMGPGLIDGQSNFQILSACATQDYYRSLEDDSDKQYPFLATIVGGSRPFCSGTLITDRHILTASHFLSNITVADVFHMRVHVGYKTAFSGQTEGPFAVRKVLKVIRHKGFSFDKLLNDIAILQLDRPVRFSEDVHPVCLSNSPHMYSNGVTQAFETGWVEDPLMKKISTHHPFIDPHILKYFSFGYKNVTWSLQQSTARVKTKDDCTSNYEFLEKSGIYITDSMVCAATEDGKSCSFKGNSGAPLFINRDGKPIQIGLVSWGIGCGHFPAVFSGVSKYLPWLEKVVQRTR